MKRFKGMRIVAFAAIFAFTVSLLAGCGGVSEEQMAELNNLRKEVQTLEDQTQNLNSEKKRLEDEIAARNKKLEECAMLKDETNNNLKKLGLK
jgi:outer membrane murein-binding lipoprotein Lpp